MRVPAPYFPAKGWHFGLSAGLAWVNGRSNRVLVTNLSVVRPVDGHLAATTVSGVAASGIVGIGLGIVT
jgi:hypothetical protein